MRRVAVRVHADAPASVITAQGRCNPAGRGVQALMKQFGLNPVPERIRPPENLPWEALGEGCSCSWDEVLPDLVKKCGAGKGYCAVDTMIWRHWWDGDKGEDPEGPWVVVGRPGEQVTEAGGGRLENNESVALYISYVRVRGGRFT